MDFQILLNSAKQNDENSIAELFKMYKPMMVNYAKIDGHFDEDLFQQLCMTFFICIHKINTQSFDKV